MNTSDILDLLFAILLVSITLFACRQNDNSMPRIQDEHQSLNEDSIELAMAYDLQRKITSTVTASIETDPVAAQSIDDAADDPAIWYNKDNPSQSLIFGSNKKGGLVSYNLHGEKIKYYELGSINNVDIIYDFALEAREVNVLGCSNRTSQSVNLFLIQPNGDLEQLFDTSYFMDSTKIDDVYGFCFGKGKSDKESYLFINGKNGLMQQYLMSKKDGTIKLEIVREVQFESQTEGMVADNLTSKLYVGEEGKGVWMLDIDPKSMEKSFIKKSGEANGNITYDIEGISIFRKKEIAFLIVSSQGNFSYAVFDLKNENNYLGSFKIIDNSDIDGVEETDGIDIISDSLSLEFPNGIFVAQDGFNYSADNLKAQNFKYVKIENILNAIDTF